MLTLTTAAVIVVVLLAMFLAYVAGAVYGEQKGRLAVLEEQNLTEPSNHD